jgi:hypothetical protein
MEDIEPSDKPIKPIKMETNAKRRKCRCNRKPHPNVDTAIRVIANAPPLLSLSNGEYKDLPCKLLELPDELIMRMMTFLNLASVIQLSGTCKKLNTLSMHPGLWERLDLQDTYLKPGKLAFLMKRDPKFLRLARTKIPDPQPIPKRHEHANPFNLIYLDLSNATICRNTLSMFLAEFANLQKLSLESVLLGTHIFRKLSTKLTVLNLAMTRNLNLPSFCDYLRSTTKLTVLNICWIEQNWTPEMFANLVNRLPSTLTQLNISGYAAVMSNFHLVSLVDHCPLLEKLDISDNYNLTSVIIPYLADLENLRHLAISRCIKISLASLEPFRNSENLEHMEVYGFTSDMSIVRKLCEWLGLTCVNGKPFLSIGRPTSELHPAYIWSHLVATILGPKPYNNLGLPQYNLPTDK